MDLWTVPVPLVVTFGITLYFPIRYTIRKGKEYWLELYIQIKSFLNSYTYNNVYVGILEDVAPFPT